MKDYKLENLLVIFEEHAERLQKDNADFLKKFKEDYPDEEPPEHLLRDFSLPRALKVICEEIIAIKNK